MAGVIVASLIGGIVLSALVWLISRFFRSVPAPKVLTEFNTAQTAQLNAERERAAARGFSLSPRAEPIVISLVSFIGIALLVSILLPSLTAKTLPAKEGGEHAEAKPAASGLAVTGDFAKIVAELPAGNADSGKTLFTAQACAGCHSLEAGKTLVGPSMAGLFTTAAKRQPNLGAKEYLYQSIVDPNKFVVSGFQPNLMTQTYAKTLTAQQMADILAYIERDLK